jgi:hypothetical protein
MFTLLIFLISVIVCEESLLKISSSSKVYETFNILFNKDSYDFSNYDSGSLISISSKLCNQTNLELLYSECFEKYENYNQEWVKLNKIRLY